MKKLSFAFFTLIVATAAFAQNEADSTVINTLPEEEIYFPMDRPSQTFNAKTAAKKSWILQMGVS